MENAIAAEFGIGRVIPGAKHFSLTLEIGASGQVSGTGRIIQTTYPPLNLSTTLSGSFKALSSGADTRQVITLTGLEASTGLVNVQATLTIDSKDGETGVASYKYLNHPGEWVKELREPVSVKWLK